MFANLSPKFNKMAKVTDFGKEMGARQHSRLNVQLRNSQLKWTAT
jgi:hypothetical protein